MNITYKSKAIPIKFEEVSTGEMFLNEGEPYISVEQYITDTDNFNYAVSLVDGSLSYFREDDLVFLPRNYELNINTQ